MNLMFTVYDTKAETYSPPFAKITKGLAIRDFTDAANNPDNMVGKYPHDYALFEIGTFDEQSAKMTAHKTPINLGLAVEFLHQDENLPSWPKVETDAQSTTDLQQ